MSKIYAAAVPIGAVGAVWSGLVRRRARARPTPATDEEELRRLAEGRGELVGLLARLGSADLRTLEAAWQPPPAPPALADWLASLIADGTVDAAVGSDGGARFRLAEGRPNPTTRVTVDAAVLERAIDRRDAELRGDSPGP